MGFSSVRTAYAIHGRAPRGAIACDEVIDDVSISEQVPRTAVEGLTEGETCLDKLCQEYLQRGLRPHLRKTFKKVSKTECWWALIDGETGLLRASPKRLVPLMCGFQLALLCWDLPR